MLAEQTNQTYTVNILSQDKFKMMTDKYNDEDGLHKIHHCSWYKSWTQNYILVEGTTQKVQS